jgi:ribonuclease BN (tRNA processing enzyme)
MEICMLGTSSGLPTPTRFGQTIVVTFCKSTNLETNLILDPGDGASSRLCQLGFDHKKIGVIVVSHMHVDHHAGLAQILKTCMHMRKKDPLIILAPNEGIQPLQSYLQASYLFDSFLGYPLIWGSLAEGIDKPIELPTGTFLTSLTNQHLAYYRIHFAKEKIPTDHTFESYSIHLTHNYRSLVYSGNLNWNEGFGGLDQFVAGCSLYLSELAHIQPDSLGQFLSKANVKRTVVTHFHPKWTEISDEQILQLIQMGAGKDFAGKIFLAKDGDIFNC